MIKKSIVVLFCAVLFAANFSGCINGRELSEEEFQEAINQINSEDYYETETETETEETTEAAEAEIAVVGDLMVHSWQMDDALKRGGGQYDFNYCFEPVSKYLSYKDLTVGNLETTFAGKEIGYSEYPCFNTPEQFGDALLNVGFDVLSTANNHCMDKGEKGIKGTINYLDSLGISHTGTFLSQEESEKILIKEANGIKFAFLSYTYGTNGIPVPQGKEYFVNILDSNKIKSDIAKARNQGADIVAVIPHIGIEYAQEPDLKTTEQIDEMIAAGADIVLASHPHILQRAEMRKVKTEDEKEREGFVIYSLANFISSQRDLPRDSGIILNLKFEKSGGKTALTQVSYIPTWVQWRDTTGSYNIRVLSVYDALMNPTAYGLRDKDIARLKNVYKESVKTVSGENVSWEQSQPELFLDLY